MSTIRRSVSSLASLATFEAAARLGSFTLAAAELGVTQAAVSRQVRRLEDDLRTPLFLRSHRRVELTAQGRILASVMTEVFGRAAETVEAIRQPVGDGTVALGTTLAFSHFWLVPRLTAFRAAHPGIRLRLISEDTGFDLRHDRLDVAIRYGVPPFADAVSLASMSDEVFPVCNPALADSIGPNAGLAAILAAPRIGLEWLDQSWLAWPRWATMVGHRGPAGQGELRFNQYTDAVYAAIAGQGVVLGWRRLIADLLADRRLVRLGDDVAVPAERYHVLRPSGRQPTPPAKKLIDWLVCQFGADA